VAIASLQAIDGHGDEAIATVTRLDAIARKVEPNARTLIRAMIAEFIHKITLQTADFVLDDATVSPVARAALDAELAAAASSPRGETFRLHRSRLYPTAGRVIHPRRTHRPSPAPWISPALNSDFWRPPHQPSRHRQFFGGRLYTIYGHAEARRIRDLEDSKNPANRPALEGYHFKNIGGRMLADMPIPSLSKVAKTYGDIDDLHLVILARLRA